ncbi:MAG TPA: hypothetical protein VHQ00_01675 [Chloroflexota bacterium]|nr:hypothetical protein [Chloroflexota bacterium]
MSEAVDEELIASVAREQVAQLAPQELPLFRAQSAAYFEDPQKALQGDRSGEDMLSFGPEVAFALLTPVILSVTSTVLSAVAEELGRTLGEESRGVAGDLVRRLFRRPPTGAQDASGVGESGAAGESGGGVQPAPVPVLTAAQLARVRQSAFERARQLDVPEARASLLADSLVGSLALA